MRQNRREFLKGTAWMGADEVDVIYNVTPWYEHAPIALCAMEHGKVILNEVPGVLTIDEGWELVETAEL